MIRYLRRDNDNIDIRRELGQMRLVQTSLIPILCEYHADETLFDVTLRLLVNLTNPTLLLFNEELPKDKVVRKYFLENVSYLQNYKPAFSSERFWIVLTDKLKLVLVKVRARSFVWLPSSARGLMMLFAVSGAARMLTIVWRMTG